MQSPLANASQCYPVWLTGVAEWVWWVMSKHENEKNIWMKSWSKEPRANNTWMELGEKFGNLLKWAELNSQDVSAHLTFKDADRKFHFVQKVEAGTAAQSDAFLQMAERHREPPAQLMADTWPYVEFEIVGLILCSSNKIWCCSEMQTVSLSAKRAGQIRHESCSMMGGRFCTTTNITTDLNLHLK